MGRRILQLPEGVKWELDVKAVSDQHWITYVSKHESMQLTVRDLDPGTKFAFRARAGGSALGFARLAVRFAKQHLDARLRARICHRSSEPMTGTFAGVLHAGRMVWGEHSVESVYATSGLLPMTAEENTAAAAAPGQDVKEGSGRRCPKKGRSGDAVMHSGDPYDGGFVNSDAERDECKVWKMLYSRSFRKVLWSWASDQAS